jgi:cell division septal protein FtsQ
VRQRPRAQKQPPPHNRGGSRRVARLHLLAWALGKIAAVAILAGGVWAVLQLLSDPQLQIREVRVHGIALIPADEIHQDLAIEGSSVFAIRSGRLERLLRLNPAVDRVRVEPRLPDIVTIAVVERMPAVLWEAEGSSALVDDNGLAIRDGPDVPPLKLPRVYAPEGPAVRAGERVDPSPVHIAQTIAPRLDALGLPGARLEYRPSNGITIFGAYRVAVGSEDQLEAKLIAYQSIRRQIEQSRARAELVDVRFLDRPYYR